MRISGWSYGALDVDVVGSHAYVSASCPQVPPDFAWRPFIIELDLTDPANPAVLAVTEVPR